MLLPVWLEAAIIVLSTVLGCALLTEAIKRVPPQRPLFGLGRGTRMSRPARQVAPAAHA